MPNLIDLKTQHHDFKMPGIQFSVSGRNISAEMNIITYLKIFYMYIDVRSIESVFGSTVVPSRLYGGRKFKPEHSFTDKHIQQLTEQKIGLALTLTNHFFDDAGYEESLPLLEKHHKFGNSIICTNNELAKRIRKDFPDYSLKASIIKEVDTHEKIEECLEIYDYLTLPMDKNDDDDFLEKIPEKERVILFANSNCAYTCPDRTCYKGFSDKNTGQRISSVCSKGRIPRLDVGEVYFDVRKLKRMGFGLFKLVPLAPVLAPAIVEHYSRESLEYV